MLYVYFFLTAAAIGLVAFISTAFQVDRIETGKGSVTDFNTGWVLDRSDGVSEHITLPVSVSYGVKKNSTSTIENTLPAELKNGMTLSFATYHSSVQVYVGRQLIYQFGVGNQYRFGKSPACTAWHFVDLPEQSAGKTITLKFCSPYDKYAGTFNSIAIGERSEDIARMVRNFLPSTIISGLVLIIGILFLVTFLIARRRMKQNMGMLYQGLFILGVSVSALSETSVFQLFIPNVLVLGYIMYFSLMLCPIPYLLFVKTVYAKNHSEWYDILGVAAAVNFVVCTLLQVTNRMDLPETVVSTHVILIAGLALSSFTACENLYRYHDSSVRPFLYGVTFMIVFFLIDVVRYYWGIYKDGALFCRMGLLIFIVLPAIDTVSRNFSMIELGMETRVLQRLAYVDMLTQKKNRTSFEKDMEKLNLSQEICKVTIATFDLNNLKQVNDNFGHLNGDSLIVGAANIIEASFSGFGVCYRIGGDEFVMILKGCEEEQLRVCLEAMTKNLYDYNILNPNKIEIAYGWAKYEEKDSSLFETLNRADEWMYRRKRHMKALANLSCSENRT